MSFSTVDYLRVSFEKYLLTAEDADVTLATPCDVCVCAFVAGDEMWLNHRGDSDDMDAMHAQCAEQWLDDRAAERPAVDTVYYWNLSPAVRAVYARMEEEAA